jgi:hypothetical protein
MHHGFHTAKSGCSSRPAALILRYSWRPPGCEERHRWLPAPEERTRGTIENGSGSGSCRWMVSAESGSSQRTVMAGSHAYSFDDRCRVKGCQRANACVEQISTRYSHSATRVCTASDAAFRLSSCHLSNCDASHRSQSCHRRFQSNPDEFRRSSLFSFAFIRS